MAKLCYRDATGVKREVPIRGRVTLGRHPNQDIQILDRVVSKEHCLIEHTNGRYSIRDIGSRNGTYVNGIRISGRRILAHGDEVSIGSTPLKFVEDRPEDSLMSKVTIHDSGLESNIRSRVTDHHERGFLPEGKISDVGVLRQNYEKLRAAVELQESIGFELSEEQLLSKILDEAFKIFPADRGVILLKSEDHEALVPKVVKTRNEKESADSIRISQTILREVQDEKTAVLSNDAMMDSRFSGAHSIILERIRSTMSVPLLYKEQLLGVIHLDSQIASGAFTEQDLQLLTGFARQAAFNIEHSRVVKKIEQEVIVRENISRMLDPSLVEEVVNGRVAITKGGDARRATILFADIRGFTGLSEKMTPQELVTLLNMYFEVMVEDIFNHGGTLDKFVGDEIMALFGAPIALPDAEFKAVSCALAMMESLEQFNTAQQMDQEIRQEEARKEGQSLTMFPPLQIGIGINAGSVVAGYVGSSKSLSYTVMGDPVNTANRFCSAAAPGEIIIGREIYDVIKDSFDFEDRGFHKLKGKSAEQHLFRVIGAKQPIEVGGTQVGEGGKLPAEALGVAGDFSAALQSDENPHVRDPNDISSTIPANARIPAVRVTPPAPDGSRFQRGPDNSGKGGGDP